MGFIFLSCPRFFQVGMIEFGLLFFRKKTFFRPIYVEETGNMTSVIFIGPGGILYY